MQDTKIKESIQKRFIERENKTNPNGTLGGKKIERKKEATKETKNRLVNFWTILCEQIQV